MDKDIDSIADGLENYADTMGFEDERRIREMQGYAASLRKIAEKMRENEKPQKSNTE